MTADATGRCPDCGGVTARCWECNAPMTHTSDGRWWCGVCETHRSDGRDGYTHWEREPAPSLLLARALNRGARRR